MYYLKGTNNGIYWKIPGSTRGWTLQETRHLARPLLAIHQIPGGPRDTQYVGAMPEKCPYTWYAPRDMTRVGYIGISHDIGPLRSVCRHILSFLGFSNGFFGGN